MSLGGNDSCRWSDSTITAVNDNPIPAVDNVTTDEDTPVTIMNVLGNDTDLDGDILSVSSFMQPGNGVVIKGSTETFTSTPKANFNGADRFTSRSLTEKAVLQPVRSISR